MKNYTTIEILSDIPRFKEKKFKLVNPVLRAGHSHKQGMTASVEMFGGDRFWAMSNSGRRIQDLTGFEEWELLYEPVPWQEALQAWADGKTVEWHYPPNDKGWISKTFYPSCLGPSRETLTTGTWYIIEDTAHE